MIGGCTPSASSSGISSPSACGTSGTPARCGCRQVGVLQHPLQVAHGGGGAQVRPAGRDERLVHVQGDRERAVDAGDIDRGATEEHRLLLPSGDRLLDPRLRTAQVRQVINVLGELSPTDRAVLWATF
jgi:hypothetical protein